MHQVSRLKAHRYGMCVLQELPESYEHDSDQQMGPLSSISPEPQE